jgi:hypothetical protein
MKEIGHLQKWASGLLGAVCLLLFVNLVMQRSRVKAGAPQPSTAAKSSPPAERVPPLTPKGADQLTRYDPVLRLDLFKTLQARPLPRLERNPFEIETPRAKALGADTAGTSAGSTAAPAGPPPVSLKAVGYTENSEGLREAFVSDDEQLYVVHEGDVFAKRFRVLTIKPTLIEVEDEALHQTVRLPLNP